MRLKIKPRLKQFRLQVERARYEAERAERRFRNVEPENRLVARTLETEWENKLQEQKAAEAELARKEQEQRLQLTDPATRTNPCSGERFETSLGRADHDGPGSKGTSAQFTGGSENQCVARGEQSPFGPALEDERRVGTGRAFGESQEGPRSEPTKTPWSFCAA